MQVLESAGRPTGVKKGKFSNYLTDRVRELSNKLDTNNGKAVASSVEVMMAELKEASKNNFLQMKLLLEENTKALTSSITFKAVMASDFSGQTARFQRRVGRNITRVVERDFFDPAYNSASETESEAGDK